MTAGHERNRACIGGVANRAVLKQPELFGCSRALDLWKDRKLSADEVENCCGAGATPVGFPASRRRTRPVQLQGTLDKAGQPRSIWRTSCYYLIAHGESVQVAL
jgi:hypothetical protein